MKRTISLVALISALFASSAMAQAGGANWWPESNGTWSMINFDPTVVGHYYTVSGCTTLTEGYNDK